MDSKADIWWEYGVAKADKHSHQGGDWLNLLQEEREAAALWKFQTDVANGGFLQFFCNWGYEAYQYALSALERIGDQQVLQLAQEAYTVIAGLENVEMESIWDIYKLLHEQELGRLEKIDCQLWACSDRNVELAYDYFCAHIEGDPR